MDGDYSGDSDAGSGGSTPVQDENEDIEEDFPAESGDVTVSHSPAASPEEDGEEEYDEGELEEGERREDSEDEEWRGKTDHTQALEEAEAVSDAESDKVSEDAGEVQEDHEDADENVEEQREDEEEVRQAASDQEEEDGEREIPEPESPPDVYEPHENVYEQGESEQRSDGEISEEEREEERVEGGVEDVSEEEQEEQEERVERQVEEDDDRQSIEGEGEERTMEEIVQDTPLSPASDTPLSPASEIASPEQFDEDQALPVIEEDRAEHDRGEERAESGDEEQEVERGDETSQQAAGDTEMYEGAEQVSDAEDEEVDGNTSEVEDGAEEQKSKKNRRRVLDSDDEDAPLQVAEETPASPEAEQGDKLDEEEVGGTQAKKDGDSGEESDEEKELIADIFGSSDEEGEEFEGFGENDLEPASKKKKSAILSSDEDDDGEPAGGAMDAEEEEEEPEAGQEEESAPEKTKQAAGSDSDEGIEPQKGYQRADFVSDFDMMMEKKKAEMGRRRKRRDVDIINDNDDIVMAMITQMKEAAEADQELNKARKAAVKKLLMYPKIMQQLQKADLQQTLLECGILSAMKDWLMPLPDKSLPHLKIRSNFLKVLRSFPPISQDLLKSSGIGKAVMILYRHPKELRVNKDLAGRIINNWSRPIFGVDDSFLAMSKEERQHRDLAQLSAVKRRRMSSQEGERPKSIEKALQQGEKALRPGDKGWIGRARVPMPSNKDYLVRPKSAIEAEFSARNFRKPPPSKLDKQLKKMKASRAKSRNPNARAINVNIAGAKMSL